MVINSQLLARNYEYDRMDGVGEDERTDTKLKELLKLEPDKRLTFTEVTQNKYQISKWRISNLYHAASAADDPVAS